MAAIKKTLLNPTQQQIQQLLLDYEIEIFSLRELQNREGFKDLELQRSLEVLVKTGFLTRIENGKYCLFNFRDEMVIGNYLAENGTIGYWSALNLHGLTEQFANTVFVQTTKWRKSKRIFGVLYQMVTIKPEKYVGVITQGDGNRQYRVTDVEKTIVDCFDLPKYSGGYPEIIKAFKNAGLSARKLVKYCKAINNISVVKRLAYLTELLNKPNMEYFINHALSVRNEKYNLFEYQGEKKGKTNRRWRLILNMTEAEIRNMAELYL